MVLLTKKQEKELTKVVNEILGLLTKKKHGRSDGIFILELAKCHVLKQQIED